MRRTACPLEGCGAAYVMQKVDSEERRKERTNPAPQWAVPRELIEWQPSYTQSGALRCLLERRVITAWCWRVLKDAGYVLDASHCHVGAETAMRQVVPL